MSEALDHRPDIPADGFRPPRWMVLTAGAVILAAGITSAAFNFDAWREKAPRFDIASTPRGSSTPGVDATMQAVPLGALVLGDRGVQQPVAARPKVDEEVPVVVETVTPPIATVPPEAPPVVPGDTAGLF